MRQRANFRDFTYNDVIAKCALPHGFGEYGSSVCVFAELYLPFEATTATISMYLSEEGTV